jgi:O-methyltransferase involved in polyketide biosynthesis
VSESLAERLPPEMFLSELSPMDDIDTAASVTSSDSPATALAAVPSTLLITLAARAHGDSLFPQVAVGDACAAPLLRRLVADPRPYLAHKPSTYGVLARTRLFRDLTARFFDSHPHATGVNLGCGLAHYSQWLDHGGNCWIDADLPEVMALRDTLLPCASGRRLHAKADLTQPGWWARLGLPDRDWPTPVTLICEGVLMYLQPEQALSVLREFGAHAPRGSQLLFDAMCWLAVGHGGRKPGVRRTGADFHWGPRRIADLAAAHPRLVLQAEHRVMEGYGWPCAVLGPVFRRVFGVPFYALYQMGVGEVA